MKAVGVRRELRAAAVARRVDLADSHFSRQMRMASSAPERLVEAEV